LIDGKQNLAMIDIRDTLASEWDTRLGVDISPSGFRRISPEYADSEWTRNQLLNEFDREWRSWMRTKDVLEVIRTGDKDKFDEIVQEKIYGKGGIIEVWKPRISEALDKVVKKKKSTTTIDPQDPLLTN